MRKDLIGKNSVLHIFEWFCFCFVRFFAPICQAIQRFDPESDPNSSRMAIFTEILAWWNRPGSTSHLQLTPFLKEEMTSWLSDLARETLRWSSWQRTPALYSAAQAADPRQLRQNLSHTKSFSNSRYCCADNNEKAVIVKWNCDVKFTRFWFHGFVRALAYNFESENGPCRWQNPAIWTQPKKRFLRDFMFFKNRFPVNLGRMVEQHENCLNEINSTISAFIVWITELLGWGMANFLRFQISIASIWPIGLLQLTRRQEIWLLEKSSFTIIENQQNVWNHGLGRNRSGDGASSISRIDMCAEISLLIGTPDGENSFFRLRAKSFQS